MGAKPTFSLSARSREAVSAQLRLVSRACGRAVELSRKGWQDAGEIASRVAARDYDKARSLINTMMEDCRTCHREYKPLS